MQEDGGHEMHIKSANLGKSETSWGGNETGMCPGTMRSPGGCVGYMGLMSVSPPDGKLCEGKDSLLCSLPFAQLTGKCFSYGGYH